MTARIPDGAKIVFCALQDFQELKLPNPKIETLAKATGKPRRTIDFDLRWLREAGLIHIDWGQRQSTYRIAENWQTLLRKLCATEKIPVTQALRNVLRKACVTEPPLPYIQDFSSKTRTIEKEGSNVSPRKLSTHEEPADARALAVVKSPAPDLLRTLEQCLEIYQHAGSPIAPRRKQLCLQLMLSLSDDERARLPARLPNYLAYAVMHLWSDAQHTKKLENVLHDGDWDTDPALRDVPAPRKQSIIEQKTQEYLRRHAKGAS